jgi:hypothetical protein
MTETTTRRPRRIRVARVSALLLAPLMLFVTSCKITDVTDPIVKPIEKVFGLDDGEFASPEFEIVNGITIKVIVKFSDLSAGLPVTVQVKCAGGTQASATVTLKDTGDISVGEATFQPTWPAGTDCLVSQDIVKGVETVKAVVTWLDSNDVQAVFQNT